MRGLNMPKSLSKLREEYERARSCKFCGRGFKRPLKTRYMGGKDRVCYRCIQKINNAGLY